MHHSWQGGVALQQQKGWRRPGSSAHLPLHQRPLNKCCRFRQARPLVADVALLKALDLARDAGGWAQGSESAAGVHGLPGGMGPSQAWPGALPSPAMHACQQSQRWILPSALSSRRGPWSLPTGACKCEPRAGPLAHLDALVGHQLQVPRHRAVAQQDDLQGRAGEPARLLALERAHAKPGSLGTAGNGTGASCARGLLYKWAAEDCRKAKACVNKGWSCAADCW